jgi:hypothetical protein
MDAYLTRLLAGRFLYLAPVGFVTFGMVALCTFGDLFHLLRVAGALTAHFTLLLYLLPLHFAISTGTHREMRK